MNRYTFGECPSEVITAACRAQCPDGYPMTICSKSEWRALSEAWNQGIDSHLEAMVRSSADASTGKVNVHPDELHVLLRRLYESDDTDEAWGLRSAILSTLDIEEI